MRIFLLSICLSIIFTACALNPSLPCNDKESCKNSGETLYEQRDFIKAAEFYAKACDMNDAISCNKVGKLYYHHYHRSTQNIEKNPDKAMEFYTKSCDLDNAEGCLLLGTLYADKKDMTKAEKLFDQACDMGDPEVCTDLYFSYLGGAPIKQDLKRRLNLLLRRVIWAERQAVVF